MLSSNAFWTKKYRSYLPEVGEQDVPETNRDIYGGIYRRHVSKINMKLNLAKCAFEVSTKKFLGLIINNRGIEANLDKIKVVLDMPPPSNIKEVQRLTGRIVAPYSVPGRFRFLNQRRPGQRQRQSVAPSLLLQLRSERSRGKVPKDGEINPGIGNHSPKTSPLLPSSYH